MVISEDLLDATVYKINVGDINNPGDITKFETFDDKLHFYRCFFSYAAIRHNWYRLDVVKRIHNSVCKLTPIPKNTTVYCLELVGNKFVLKIGTISNFMVHIAYGDNPITSLYYNIKFVDNPKIDRLWASDNFYTKDELLPIIDSLNENLKSIRQMVL